MLQTNQEKSKILNNNYTESKSKDSITKSLEAIIFDEVYLKSLKENISKLQKRHISQKKLKELILTQGFQYIENFKDLLDFHKESKKENYKKKIKVQEEKIIEYKELLLKAAPRIEEIYRKLKNR